MLRRLVPLFAALAFACSGTDDTPDAGTGAPDAADTTPDAGDQPDAGDEPDAGEDLCEQPCTIDPLAADCSCFWNADCNVGFRCSDDESPVCECGERGTGAYDEACTGSTDCESGLCSDGFCTKDCTSDDDCTGTNLTRCQMLFGICVAP